MDSLNKIYHKMVKGGIIIIDDCGWDVLPGCKKAVEDFLQDKLVDKKAGKNLCTCKFDTLAGAFTKHLKEQLQTKEINLMVYKLNVYAIHNYLLPFFKEKDINTINRAVIEQYVDYRKQNSRNGKVPNNDTVNRSIIIFKNIFKHAFKKGLIGESQLIQFKLLPVKTNRRQRFRYNMGLF